MNKTFRRILFLIIGLAVAWLVVRAVSGKGNEGIKFTAENMKRRTVIETVTATVKVYPAT